jgi:acyl carrier protein
MNSIEKKIRGFVSENFLFREDHGELASDESLLDAGLIDSTGVLELVAFLEKEFQLQMADEDIVPDNLDSIARITAYVARKTALVAA